MGNGDSKEQQQEFVTFELIQDSLGLKDPMFSMIISNFQFI